jgi:hypothetical protein
LRDIKVGKYLFYTNYTDLTQMDSFSLTFDVKGMVNGKYVLVASAIAVGVSWIAISAKEIIIKYLNKAPVATKSPTVQQIPPSTLSSNIIEDYTMM